MKLPENKFVSSILATGVLLLLFLAILGLGVWVFYLFASKTRGKPERFTEAIKYVFTTPRVEGKYAFGRFQQLAVSILSILTLWSLIQRWPTDLIALILNRSETASLYPIIFGGFTFAFLIISAIMLFLLDWRRDLSGKREEKD